jgi:TolA-binding protein
MRKLRYGKLRRCVDSMAFDPIATLNEWKHKVASLQERWRGARREIEQLRQENEKLRRREQQLEQREKQLEREQERLRQENERLKRQLEQAQRASKRQAAPFSRGTRKQNPKTPGRKSGSAYGQRPSKDIPPKVDEVIAVPPVQCACGGPPGSRADRAAVLTGNRA